MIRRREANDPPSVRRMKRLNSSTVLRRLLNRQRQSFHFSHGTSCQGAGGRATCSVVATTVSYMKTRPLFLPVACCHAGRRCQNASSCAEDVAQQVLRSTLFAPACGDELPNVEDAPALPERVRTR